MVPVADPMIFTATKDRLSVAFRGSNGGPGFHAAVVDFLDHLEGQLRLKWIWTATDGSSLDEAGYATTRDFAQLQRTMTGYMTDLVAIYADPALPRPAAFCVPFGIGLEVGKIACPLGYKPDSWIEMIADADEPERLAAAAAFFPWWNAGFGAETVESLLRAQLWQNAEWRVPVSDRDRLVHNQILHTSDWLGRLKAPLPADLRAALAEYHRLHNGEDPPDPVGIGYRKRGLYEQIFRSWAITRPAFAWPVDNGDGAAWEHPDFWLGASAITVMRETGEEHQDDDWPGGFTGPTRRVRPGILYRLSRREQEEGGPIVQHAQVISSRPDRKAILILTLSSPLEWPHKAFEAWVNTVVCPDLPDADDSARGIPSKIIH